MTVTVPLESPATDTAVQRRNGLRQLMLELHYLDSLLWTCCGLAVDIL